MRHRFLAFEHFLISSAAKPIQIANLILPPYIYIDMHMQTWPRSPGINIATQKKSRAAFPGVAPLQTAEVSQL